MTQRRLLLVAAVVVAALGTVLVLVYARGADTRAQEGMETVEVLTASSPIEIGESVAEADAAGKFTTSTVPANTLLPGAQTDLLALEGLFATQRIYTGEQIVSDKFGGEAATSSALAIPRDKVAASVELTDPQRVAGFISPGSFVTVVYTGTRPASGDAAGGGTSAFSGTVPGLDGNFSRILLRRVQVLGVGSTTPTTTTTTNEDGAQTTEQVPTTLLTLALDEDELLKLNYAVVNATQLSMALQTDDSEIDGLGVTVFGNLFEN